MNLKDLEAFAQEQELFILCGAEQYRLLANSPKQYEFMKLLQAAFARRGFILVW